MLFMKYFPVFLFIFLPIISFGQPIIKSDYKKIEFSNNQCYWAYVFGNNNLDGDVNAVLVMTIKGFHLNNKTRTGSWEWRFDSDKFGDDLEIIVKPISKDDGIVEKHLPAWLKQEYPNVILNKESNFVISGMKAKELAFIGIETDVFKGADGQIISKTTTGKYREYFYIYLPNFPYPLGFYVDTGQGIERISINEVSNRLKQYKFEVDRIKKSLQFKIIKFSNSVNSGIGKNNQVSNTDESNDDTLWTIIIGLLSAAAVAGFVRKLKKGKKNSKDKNKKEQAHYILQLNKENFNLFVNKPQQLQVNVWKITDKGKTLMNAKIRIQNSEKALKIIPKNSTGTLKSQLLLKDKPQNSTFYLTVTATVEGHTISKQIKIETSGEMKIVVETYPDNSKTLRPNIGQTLTCYAKVVDENGENVDKLSKAISFDGTHSDWLDLSDPIWDEDGWIGINIQASDPDANVAVSHPPKSITLGIYVEYEEDGKNKRLENNLTIELLDCILDVSADTFTFPATKTQSEVTFDAFIKQCDGKEPWKITANYKTDDYKPDNKPITRISVHPISDKKVKIKLSGPLLIPKDNEQYLRKMLLIEAQQKDEKPLQREVYVTVSKEGLFIEKGVNDKNEILLNAKGDFKSEIAFSLFKYNKDTKTIEADKEGLQYLELKLLNDGITEKNIDKALGISFDFRDYINSIPHAAYTLEAPNKLPGKGDVYTLKYKVSIIGNKEDDQAFTQNIYLKVKTYGIGETFPDWNKAYEQCKYTIIEYVPKSTQRHQLLDLLEKNKYKLDIEGMVAYRKRVWAIANDLLINKAEGYLAIANWYDAVIDTLEWVVWMGDIAFQVLLSTYTGYAGALAANTFKQTFLTGVRLAIEGKSVNDFVDEEIEAIKEMIYSDAKGRIVNTQTIEKFYKGNKVKVWAIYAVATFALQYHRTGSIPQAAKETARQLRDEMIIRFLHGKIQEEQSRIQTEKNDKIRKEVKARVREEARAKYDYTPADVEPDLSGYSGRSVKFIRNICKKYNVKIITRPTNKFAKNLIESRQAVPKKMFVKNKTINELDTFLGASEKDIGKVGSFKPKFSRKQLRGLPKEFRRKVVKRYRQRDAEWIDQAEHIKENIEKGNLFVKDGVIHDAQSGKPFTGDIDIFDIRGANGEKLPKKTIQHIVNELTFSNRFSSVEHGAHVEWDWKSIKDPNDRRIAKQIYDKIMDSHKKGGEALVEFTPELKSGELPHSVYHKE